MTASLTEQLGSRLTEHGAGIVACADLVSLPADVRKGLPQGICIGVPLKPEIVTEIKGGPTSQYAAEYDRVNSLLNELCDICADFLKDAGHQAVPIKATLPNKEIHFKTLSTALPHKTVARLAGVGWIGKCALLVTEEFGSAIRYSTVLTDAPLSTGVPNEASKCGDCSVCVAICPAGAPTGRGWKPGSNRDDFFDAQACCEAARRQTLEIGVDGYICGRCIAACPHTQKYLRQVGQ
jgi:epoxyqueuosine reductase